MISDPVRVMISDLMGYDFRSGGGYDFRSGGIWWCGGGSGGCGGDGGGGGCGGDGSGVGVVVVVVMEMVVVGVVEMVVVVGMVEMVVVGVVEMVVVVGMVVVGVVVVVEMVVVAMVAVVGVVVVVEIVVVEREGWVGRAPPDGITSPAGWGYASSGFSGLEALAGLENLVEELFTKEGWRFYLAKWEQLEGNSGSNRSVLEATSKVQLRVAKEKPTCDGTNLVERLSCGPEHQRGARAVGYENSWHVNRRLSKEGRIQWLTPIEFLRRKMLSALKRSLYCSKYVTKEGRKVYRYVEVLKPEIKEVVVTTRCTNFYQMHESKLERPLEVEIADKEYRWCSGVYKDNNRALSGGELTIEGDERRGLPKMCTLAKARKHVLHGGRDNLAYVIDIRDEAKKRTVAGVPVVSEFQAFSRMTCLAYLSRVSRVPDRASLAGGAGSKGPVPENDNFHIMIPIPNDTYIYI
ncbi:hypothetical protein OSB04_002272 [Centaurea solstitialis]|uniref:Uncharacterized protein n=1 Tax=Centaurea solstitialis TaxID=347529 RepID=A0AA38U370_9ASTR|nr:hypothetical protein OSB04_002272 [Centaurea solstitialis]